jgi:hypothetical protein
LGLLGANIGVKGFDPGGFPQLIISGSYSLAKANGLPYSAPLVNGEWPFYFSTPVNPLLLLLEFIWTRLDELFNMPELWGKDLDLEVPRALLFVRQRRSAWVVHEVYRSVRGGIDFGTDDEAVEPRIRDLRAISRSTATLRRSERQNGWHKLLNWLQERGIKPEVLRDNLLETGLVAMRDQELQLITRNCLCAVLPSDEYVAAENNAGRLTRWIAKQMTSALKPEWESMRPFRCCW